MHEDWLMTVEVHAVGFLENAARTWSCVAVSITRRLEANGLKLFHSSYSACQASYRKGLRCSRDRKLSQRQALEQPLAKRSYDYGAPELA